MADDNKATGAAGYSDALRREMSELTGTQFLSPSGYDVATSWSTVAGLYPFMKDAR